MTTGSRRHAAVAMVLRDAARPGDSFIERARHRGTLVGRPRFPAARSRLTTMSRVGPPNAKPSEEIGLDLQQACYLGRLDDLAGAHLPVVISCFVMKRTDRRFLP
jgi:hypothetical protein